MTKTAACLLLSLAPLLAQDPGRKLFDEHCAACHGVDAGGSD